MRSLRVSLVFWRTFFRLARRSTLSSFSLAGSSYLLSGARLLVFALSWLPLPARAPSQFVLSALIALGWLLPAYLHLLLQLLLAALDLTTPSLQFPQAFVWSRCSLPAPPSNL